MNYYYPIDETWTTEEVVHVVQFLSLIEKAYESKVNREEVILQYKRFKQVVPSKSEEKALLKQFEKESGYVGYHVLKKAKESESALITMK
ncbi:UPF0223 family protein [Virgibacillus kimchii]